MIGLVLQSPVLPQVLAEISMERIQELQRFAEVGRVSASLIHDMTSPLTAAILHLEQEEQRGLPSIIRARRSIRVLERYIEAARQQLRQQDRSASFYIKREVSQVKHILQPLARQRRLNLRFSVLANYKLHGDPVRFQQIIINLVTNAMDAYLEAGSSDQRIIRVTVSKRRERLVIRVQDWGKGIKSEQLLRVFEPFYTTKQSGAVGGTGIGLSTVRQYVEDDFGGNITASSSSDEGTEFRVELPMPGDNPKSHL